MNAVSPFREIDPQTRRVSVHFDGEELFLAEGANLAAALLAANIAVFRHTPASGAPRAPFCMMGACFDCLVEIEGVVRQACMVEVEESLRLCRPKAGEEARRDV